jgi:hypothetical protein
LSRKKIGARKRRGRPRLANAKRRMRTRIGRATGQDPIDNGSPQLVQRKVRATNRGDLELSGIGVLYGHREIDGEQYETLTAVSLWVMRQNRAWGARDGSCEGLWRNILAAASRAGFTPNPTNDTASGPADTARRQLLRLRSRLNGSFDLVMTLTSGAVPELVLRLIEGTTTVADKVELERLRQSLDRLAGKRMRQDGNIA